MEYPITITIEEYLIRNGISYRPSNGELITTCVFCDKKNHLYFNTETTQYDCKVCGEKGNIFTLAKFFGDDIKDIIINNNNNNNTMTTKETPMTISEEKVVEYNKALPGKIREYLNNRGITDEIIEKNMLGWGSFYSKGWITIPVYDEFENCKYFKLRANPLLKNTGPRYLYSHKGCETLLYGLNSIKDSKDIVICEGEFDQMILELNGISAVSNTSGAGTYKTEWNCIFTECENIYICFDNDEPGQKGMEKVCQELLKLNGPKIWKIFLPEELGDGGDITDYFLRGFKPEDLFEKYSKPQEVNNSDSKKEISKPAQVVGLVLESGATLFIDQFNEPHIAINGNGCKLVKVDSTEFDTFIHGLSYKNSMSFGSESIKTAKKILESMAFEDNNIVNLSVRVAKDLNNNIWYDLGEKAVKINKDSWEVSNESPILFRRFRHQQSQVIPIAGGSIDDILKFINVKNEMDRILLKVYLVTCFIPGFPHPVLVVFGEHGSAKSSTFRILKSTVDPSDLLTLAPIKDRVQFVQTVSHHWMALFDNLSGLSSDLSDDLCRACTGEGFSKRKLYSDDDDYVYNMQHCIGINGISNVISKADLLDRSLLIELGSISSDARRSEEKLKNEFNLIKPQIVGSCFDILSKAMKIKPSIEVPNLPRMADFTQWGYAITEAMGIRGEVFMNAYRNNIEKQNEEAIDSSPIGLAIIQLLNNENGRIHAEPSWILEHINDIADKHRIDRSRDYSWPKNERFLWKKLLEISPNLKAQGIRIQKGRDAKRFILIEDTTRNNPVQEIENDDDVPSLPSSIFGN